MSVIAEYTVSAADFILGRAAPPETIVDLERFVPNGDTVVPYFWATDGRTERFEAALRDLNAVEDLKRIDGVDDQHLYRGVCKPTSDSLTGGILEFDVRLLQAAGNHEEWNFQLGFDSAETLSDFQTFVVDTASVTLQLKHIYNPIERAPGIQSKLTPRQREALLTAYESGYFDIPRKITLVDLAEKLGVSDQAVSERMRRGESKLIQAHLLGDLDDADD